MAKAIPNSKRSICKRLKKEIRKLLPGMAVFIRRKPGELHVWREANEIWVSENWSVFIGNKHWGKEYCQMHGHVIWSCRPDLVKWIKEDLERYRTIPK